jgi:hypothetical protein
LTKAGKVFATATEDMDALTFGANVLLRHMTFSEARKMPIQEFYLDKVLEQLELTMEQVRWRGWGHEGKQTFVLCLLLTAPLPRSFFLRTVYRPLHHARL